MYKNEDGQMYLFEDAQTTENTNDFAEFKEVAREQFEKIQNKSMALGIRVASKLILDKIAAAMNKPSKRSLNDYRRLVKEIEDFCSIAIKQELKENEDDA